MEEKDSVVKIDSSLLKRVEDFIRKKENRYKFVNKKQFINVAVNELLGKFEKKRDKK